MTPPSAFFLAFPASVVGLALSADSGFDWGTDEPDDDYESPFADETDESFDVDDEPGEPDENPFADVADEAETDDATPPPADSSDDADPDGSPPPDSASSEPDASPDSEAPPDATEPTLATVADARALCDEAMDFLHAGEPARAFDRLSAHWAFSQDEMTELQREVERTRAVVADRYGESLDYRLVRDDTTADVLARFVYLERFELHGLRWRFTFYEGADGWTLNDVFFDDEIEALLE